MTLLRHIGRLSLCAAIVLVAASGRAQAQAHPDYLHCRSWIGAAYTPNRQEIFYQAESVDLATVTDSTMEIDGVLRPDRKESRSWVVQQRFQHWMKYTGQWGRWNSLWSDYISCDSRSRPDAPPVGITRQSDGVLRDTRRPVLPAGWAYVPPSRIPASEIAKLPRLAPIGQDDGHPAGLTVTNDATDGEKVAGREARRRAFEAALQRQQAVRRAQVAEFHRVHADLEQRLRARIRQKSPHFTSCDPRTSRSCASYQ